MSACMNSEGGDDVMCLSDHSESETTFEDFVNSLPLREPDINFKVLDEEEMKAHEKKIEANRNRRERDKRKREEKAAQREEDSEKPAKKVKKPAEPDNAQKITIYVEIQPQATWQQPKASKKTTKPVIIKKGPSFFTVEDSFDAFKQIVAKAIPCKPKLLPVENMEWRYEKPGNDPRKPLTNTEGYKVMTMSLSERKSGFVVYISIPPPKVDDVTWDTGEGDHVDKPYDYFEETSMAPPGDLSAKAQIAAIQTDSSGYLKQLQEQYPTGNCNLWPDQRTYSRSTGGKVSYWQLNTLRLQIWANALATSKDGVTLREPPNSSHFDLSAARKPPPNAVTNSAVPMTADPGPTPAPFIPPQYPYAPPPNLYAPPYAPPLYAPPPWGYHPPGHLYQYPQAMSSYGPPPPGKSHETPPVAGANNSPFPSPGKISPFDLKIPLDRFCTRYEIPESNRVKLASLEYIPGNKDVMELEESDWKEAGFSKLGWKAFLRAHRQFIKDAKDGLWAV